MEDRRFSFCVPLSPRKRSLSKPEISPPIPGLFRSFSDLQIPEADLSTPVHYQIIEMASRLSTNLLEPRRALNEQALQQKNAVKREAKQQAEAIHEKLRRLGHEIPKFEFLELIGKGAYGRVFKW